jgi:NADP-dependent 3-hydroxy acid dehydrogenase YdfG
MESKVWFITGASSGFGRGVLERILANGDRAVAVARNTSSLHALGQHQGDRLLVVKADVCGSPRMSTRPSRRLNGSSGGSAPF